MGIRSDRSKKKAKAAAAEEPRGLSGPTGERVTAFVLVLITAFLAYVYFVFLPSQDRARNVSFDFENPMLRARTGDCVRAQAADEPGSEMCFIVNRRVERPARGPASLPGHRDLRETLPYLVLDLHVERGRDETCAGASPTPTLRALNNFGLPPSAQVLVERIVPVWAKWSGGKEGVLYEVTMQRYDTDQKYVCFMSPDMPVMGLVKQEVVSTDGLPQRAFFREIDCDR